MRVPVVASGPIELTNAAGKQLSIPLSMLEFQNGDIHADKWPLYAANKERVDALLEQLRKAEVIKPGTLPPPKPAMKIEAVDPGSAGNHIAITFEKLRLNTTNPLDSLVDVTVRETDIYRLLTPATIKEVLGTTSSNGKQPGLVFVSSSGAPALPKAGDYDLTGGDGTKPAEKDIDPASGSGAAFTVKAKNKTDDSNRTKVKIDEVKSTEGTFTLIATWEKKETDKKVSDIKGTNLFGYEIKVSDPDGGTFAPPQPGSFGLTGGADKQDATQATATVMANA